MTLVCSAWVAFGRWWGGFAATMTSAATMTAAAAMTAAALAGGCLPDDPPVRGRLLYPGTAISNPRFRTLDNEPWVLFDVRTERAHDGLAAKIDLHLTRFSDGAHRLLMANRAARGEWPVLTGADRAGFYMTDERTIPELGLPVGTLVRMRLTGEVVETIDDIVSYGMHPDRTWFYYRRYVPDSPQPEMHLRDLQGNDRNLGPTTGPLSFFGTDAFYYLNGPDRVLTRVNGLTGEPRALRPRVSRFWLHRDQRYAVLAVADEGQVRTRILDLDSGEERSLAVDNPCCWLWIENDTFTYAEGAGEAGEGSPAALHRFDLVTGADDALALPEGMADVQGIVDRPRTSEALLIDRHRNLALLRQSEAGTLAASTAELLPLAADVPMFTNDGRHLLFVEKEPPPPPPVIRRSRVGRLLVQDASDWTAPPRLLSPTGTSCLIEPRGYIPNVGSPEKVLFWAHYGLGTSDLYLSDLDTGDTRKLVVAVGPVTMIQTRLLGIARIGQDHTGDLVQKDLITGQEQVLEHGVVTVDTHADPTLGDIAAFVVRERSPDSPRNGLWAAPLPAF
jgi:hypothetical protein